MPTYDYRCARCGPFRRVLPMREVSETVPCPDCREPSPRLFGAPALLGGPNPLRRARAAAEASADQPEVVHRAPAAEPAPQRLPGRLAGLPRP